MYKYKYVCNNISVKYYYYSISIMSCKQLTPTDPCNWLQQQLRRSFKDAKENLV